MRKRTFRIVIIIGIIMLLGSIFPLLNIFYGQTMKGTVEPNWAYPKGITLSNVKEGSEIHMEFSSTEIVELYLLTRQDALEYRSPLYEKDPLPQPLIVSKGSEIDIEFSKSGDHEILVLPVDGSFDFRVEYTIKGLKHDGAGAYVSLSFFLLSGTLIIAIPFTIRRLNQKKGHE